MTLGPEKSLPISSDFANVDEYVESLLQLGTRSRLLQTLCGGVHVLDFFTRKPDIYTELFPPAWRDWFEPHNIMDILDLMLRENLNELRSNEGKQKHWRNGPFPPKSLLDYLYEIRRHLLNRNFVPVGTSHTYHYKRTKSNIPIPIAVGMKEKKVHEIDCFSRYIDKLTNDIAVVKGNPITHLVDFGSGQNYLGRTLASEVYNKHIIAIESRKHNIEGSKLKDMHARLTEKPKVIVNKKLFREKQAHGRPRPGIPARHSKDSLQGQLSTVVLSQEDIATQPDALQISDSSNSTPTLVNGNLSWESSSTGSIQYVSHRIQNGDLTEVINQIVEKDPSDRTQQKGGLDETDITCKSVSGTTRRNVPTSTMNLMTISLHSCGNLLNHGLRTLILNPNVTAVCMVGCCYNLLTERLGPATYKVPSLRPAENPHPRLVKTSTFDPHGFPMSNKFVGYPIGATVGLKSDTEDQQVNLAEDLNSEPSPIAHGIRLNITARMMGVQAPQNWGPEESDRFFTRHFYRALLHRILLDFNLIPPPQTSDESDTQGEGWTPCSPAGSGSGGFPVIIGNLRESCYKNFTTYVRGAAEKLASMPDNTPENDGPSSCSKKNPKNMMIAETLRAIPDTDIESYYANFSQMKHHLSIVWSFMAYSAGIVEAMIVVDRWLWLKEQNEVGEAWVEAVFDYKRSPRNLCIVAVKK
jgi:hypothetical protein